MGPQSDAANGDDSRWLCEEEADGRKGTLREKRKKITCTSFNHEICIPFHTTEMRLCLIACKTTKPALPSPLSNNNSS